MRRRSSNSSRRVRQAAVIALACAATTSAVRGATVSWTDPGGGKFHEIAHWNSGAGPVPANADTAVFDLAAAYTTSLYSDPILQGLTIAGSDVSFVTDSPPRTFRTNGFTANSGKLTLAASPNVLTFTTSTTNILPGAGLYVNGGNHVTTTSAPTIAYSTASSGGVGTLSVDGAGSSFALGTGGGITQIADKGGVANLSFTNGATGSFRDLYTYGGTYSHSGATMTVSGGSVVGITGYFQWGTTATTRSRTGF